MKPYQRLFFVVVLPLLMLTFAAWMAGASTMHCHRVDGQVNCTTNSTRWLGLVTSASESIPAVQEAKSETYSCPQTRTKNGKSESYSAVCSRLLLVTSAGEVRPDFTAADSYALNDFLRSEQPTWMISAGNWPFALVLAAFGLLWLLGGWAIAKSKAPQQRKPKKKKIGALA